jgi:hypothetical protein
MTLTSEKNSTPTPSQDPPCSFTPPPGDGGSRGTRYVSRREVPVDGEVTTHRQRLLRPDQAVAAVVMARAGSTPEEVAGALGVSVDLVRRSLRLSAQKEPADSVGAVRMVFGPVVVVGEQLSLRKLRRPEGWRAPVWIEDDPLWPPVAAAADRWQVEIVREGRDATATALRDVALWDSRVLIDGERRVFCVRCRRLVPVVELGRDLYRGQEEILGGGNPAHVLEMPPERRAAS